MTHAFPVKPSLQLIANMVNEVRAGDLRSETRDLECRFSAVGDDGAIEGIAVRFNVVDSYRTEFAPDAFKGIDGRSVPLLWSHDPANVIGSCSFQTRADMLTAKGKLNLAVAKAQEVRALVQAGDVTGLSIGFRTLKDERRTNGIRRITEARLIELSIVAFPAVPGSAVTSIRTAAGLDAFTLAIRNAATALKGH